MLVAVEYVVTGNEMEQFEVYSQSTHPRSWREVRRTVARIRWGHRWALYVLHIRVLSLEVLVMPLPMATT